MRFIAPSSILCGALLLVAGCGPLLKTYPVQGQIVLQDGDVQNLADAHIEFVLDSDAKVRGSALIAPDGSFAVQMLHQGDILSGLPAGKYQVRLLLDNQEDAPRAGKGRPVHPRFLNIKTSGLAITVPSPEDLAVTVSKR